MQNDLRSIRAVHYYDYCSLLSAFAKESACFCPHADTTVGIQGSTAPQFSWCVPAAIWVLRRDGSSSSMPLYIQRRKAIKTIRERGAQDVHLDCHTAPEVCRERSFECVLTYNRVRSPLNEFYILFSTEIITSIVKWNVHRLV